ncbi:MAG: zinc metalloprotease HtpX [Ignavibacteria bacterium]|jgi:heat shock protein HtpX|nr:zinc metalloprotease HtpX [Ignavibacteria bacterium]MDH7527860.1 zinc metalloprotease HtpX [Ignavibacteria bacterium]NPV11890.1 zinc metalloprotease HtpX [Ignavibacteria bacterium]
MNTIKTVFLMTLMMMLFLLVGGLLGGRDGLVIAFIFSLGMNFFSYWFSDKIVLAMYGAKEITEREAPQLYRLVRKLTQNAGLPMPKVYVIDNPNPNAFATGRNPQNAAVAVTTGILRILNDDELEGVLAHELAHIKHRDILLATIVATFVGTITFISRMAGWTMMFAGGNRDREDSGNVIASLVLLIVAPIAAVILQLAISRAREFMADEGGARISGKPLSLASALSKLEQAAQMVPMQNANPSTAHLFIVNPLRGGGIAKLFSTHPPIEERIKRLQLIAQGRI